jgi:GNAT superfamily N-acetyltransferase
VTVQIVPVDPLDASDVLIAAWHRVRDGVAAEQYAPWHVVYSIAEMRARHRLERTVQLKEFAAVLGEEVVGTLEVELPLVDNRRRAELYVTVRSDVRRRGVGGALLAAGERLAAREDRTVLGGESDVAAVADTAPVQRFATRHGYQAVHTELRSDAVLPLPAGRLGPIDDEVSSHSAGYDIQTSVDVTPPEEWLAGRADLSRRMILDAPMGGLDYEEEVWDAGRVRQEYVVARAQGRRVVESIARHVESGDFVGYTTIQVPAHTPQHALQWDTLVRADHRGHRLGLALKVANLRALQAHAPDVVRISTYNAAENEPMLRVNRALGFHVVGTITEWQKRS